MGEAAAETSNGQRASTFRHRRLEDVPLAQ